jgi:hypothetical protein
MGALALDPTNANHWATLGVVGQERALQQHALIRALQINPKLSAAWVNLGQVSTSANMRHTLEKWAPDVAHASDKEVEEGFKMGHSISVPGQLNGRIPRKPRKLDTCPLKPT